MAHQMLVPLEKCAVNATDKKNQNGLPDGKDGSSMDDSEAIADPNDQSERELAAVSQETENQITEKKVVRAANSSQTYAELEVEVSFSQDGRHFTCNAVRYIAGSNGRKSGNLFLRFYTLYGAFAKRELTNDDGQQDQVWRPISGGSTIGCDATDATVELEYIYDIGGSGDLTLKGNIQLPYVPAVPVVTPKNVTNTRIFDITGTGAITVAGAVLSVFNDSDAQIANATIYADGTWKASVSIPANANSLTLYAKQTIGGKTSARSNSVTVFLALFATIASPTEGATIRIENLVFTGATNPGANIVVVRNDDHYKALTESKIEPSGSWTRPLLPTVMLPSGELKVEAQYSLGSHGYSPVRTINVESYPIITAPDPGSENDTTFTVWGTGGRPSARLFIQKDQDPSTVYGSTSVSANGWSVQATLPPGRHTVTPEQVMGGVRSGPGVPRTYVITPPAVTDLMVKAEANGDVTVSCKAHVGAELQIHFTDNETPIATLPVTSSSWSKVFTDWLPGKGIGVRVRQRVADGIAAWIYSGWAQTTFDNPVPHPGLEYEVSTNGTPRFFGTARVWPGPTQSQVEVRLDNTGTPVVPIVSVNTDRTWSSTAAEPWQIGTYPVTARLGFGEQWSTWKPPVEVKILPSRPTIDPIDENGLSPPFSGTCLAGATVSVTFSGDGQTYNATVSGTSWSFLRDQPFVEGEVYTITAIQTVAGQPSLPAVVSFSVYLERLTPKITTPAQKEEVDSDLTVTGDNGMADASMQLWDAQDKKPLGAPVTLSQNGAWAIHLTGLAIDAWFISAQQTLNGRPSEHSDIREFNVVVMPPEFQVPRPGDNLPRTSVLSGNGRPNGRVTVWCKGIDEPLLRDVLIGPSGVWEGSVKLEVGEKVFWATQTFEGKTSKPSLEVACRFVPHAVLPESPIPEERLGKTVTVSGFAVPGDQITLKRGGRYWVKRWYFPTEPGRSPQRWRYPMGQSR